MSKLRQIPYGSANCFTFEGCDLSFGPAEAPPSACKIGYQKARPEARAKPEGPASPTGVTFP
jgi:hypothetical protein